MSRRTAPAGERTSSRVSEFGARVVRLAWGAALLWLGATVQAADNYDKARARMIEEIEADFTTTRLAVGRTAPGRPVIDAMARVPRHEFVPSVLKPLAYENRPLPIGHGQTISQPYIVALMTDLLELQEGDAVLEIGTGSAYQAAVLAELVARVYTMEIIEPLGQDAEKRLQRLGYDNVRVRIGDGYYGWEEHAPYDAIIVTAAAAHIPPPLIRQLKPGGIMVIPVGERFQTQQLVLVRKDPAGTVRTRQVLPVRFVPLTGER